MITLFQLAISPGEIVDTGKQIGTANNQILLGILVVVTILATIALGAVVAYLHRDGKRQTANLHAENREQTANLLAKLEQRESAMTEERKARISMLLQQQKEDIEVKKDLSHAVENSTAAIDELKEFMKQQLDMQQKFFENLVSRIAA